MGNRRANHSGFSSVIVVLSGAVIAVIAVSGLVLYQHHKSSNTKSTAAATSPSTTTILPKSTVTTQPAQTATQNIIKIPELGIQITVPNNIRDLTYQANTVTLSNGNKGTYALLSTTSLAAADSKCGASSASLGSLETASGQYPSNDPYAALDYGPLLKQFPTFYVTYAAPQGGCATGNSARTAQNTNKAAFQAALSTVQPLN